MDHQRITISMLIDIVIGPQCCNFMKISTYIQEVCCMYLHLGFHFLANMLLYRVPENRISKVSLLLFITVNSFVSNTFRLS